MPKIRRNGHVFVSWIDDYSPRHVHVYRNGKLVVKWSLDDWMPMRGQAPRRLLRWIHELVREGRL